MYPNMLYTKDEVLKKEGHIVSCECDAYLGVSVKIEEVNEGHVIRLGRRVMSMTVATFASGCRVKDVHHIHRTTLRA